MSDTKFIELEYPRSEGNAKYIQIGLMDLRASDDIRVEYDFQRDGWVISQASVFEWSIEDSICDPLWKEVVFIPAWGQKFDE